MCNIDIISGFLGAGKTTLIQKLLREVFQGEKVVLIENEFGEIGIDGGFLKEAGVEITEMNSGCICCSLVGDFGTALKKVLDEHHPDRIIIEPSGVGKLSDVIAAVERVQQETQQLTLHSFVTVVDATKARIYMKNFGEFFNNQVEHASAILLSRTQNMDEARLQTAVNLLRGHNERAAILTTPWEQLTGAQILSAMEGGHSLAEQLLSELHHEHHHHGEDCDCGCHDHDHHHEHEHDHGESCDCGCHDHEHHHEHEHDHGESCDCDCHDHDHHHEHEHDHGESCDCGCHDHEHHHEHNDSCGCDACLVGSMGHHHHHHADEIFMSWGRETPHKYSREDLQDALSSLAMSQDYGVVLRAKGMVPCEDGSTWLHFDLVPGEFQIRDGAADYTGRLCVIGSDLKEAELAKLFCLE